MKPYALPRHPTPIDLRLSSNEGRPPRDLPPAEELLVDADPCRYPDAGALRADLAASFEVSADRVLVTAGGDDLLLRVALAHLGPQRDAVAAAPTFEMIPRHVELARATLREVPWTAGTYPIDAVLDTIGPKTGVVFLVTPNNPTGLAAG